MVAANYLIGGLLAGGGQAVQQDGVARRDAFYRDLENLRSETRADARQKSSQDFQSAQTDKTIAAADARATADSGRLKDTIVRTGKDGKPHTIGLDKDGNEIKDYGVAYEKPTASGRLYPIEQPDGSVIYGTEADALGSGVPKNKAQMDAAAAAAPIDDGSAPAGPREQAIKEADAKTGYFSSRATEFPDDGGDYDAFVNRRAAEIQKGLKPGALIGKMPKAAAADQGASPSPAVAPSPSAAPDPIADPTAAAGDVPFGAVPPGAVDPAQKFQPGAEAAKRSGRAPGPAAKGEPPIPPQLQAIPGLVYSPRRQQYKDPATGTVYDKNGDPVAPPK